MDPLVQQMSTLNRQKPEHQPRERRFSDPDRPRPSQRSTPRTIKSKDRSRFLPLPDSQTFSAGIAKSPVEAIKHTISTPTAQHDCNGLRCSMKVVFDTTELLELIMSFLDACDVLRLRFTERKWAQTVKDSPNLRHLIFTKPQWLRNPADFILLKLGVPGLEISRGEQIDRGCWIEISMTPEAADGLSSRGPWRRRVRSRSIFEGMRGGLGPTADREEGTWPRPKRHREEEGSHEHADLFVSQPPLVGMQAFLMHTNEKVASPKLDATHDQDEDFQDQASLKLCCDAGLTVGFLADTAKSLFGSSCSEDATDVSSRLPARKILFKAIISFCAPNQALRQRSEIRRITRIES